MKTYFPYLLLLLILLLTSYSCESNSNCACLTYAEQEEANEGELLVFTKAIDVPTFRAFMQEDELELLSTLDSIFKPNFSIGESTSYNTPQLGFSTAADTAKVSSILNQYFEQLESTNKPQLFWGFKSVRFTNDTSHYFSLYASRETDISGLKSININRARKSINPDDGSIGVSISMDKEGAEIWGEYTANHMGKFVAIISYNKVLSAPVIRAPIRGGETLLSHRLEEQEADDLADLINCNTYAHNIGWEEFEKLMKECRK